MTATSRSDTISQIPTFGPSPTLRPMSPTSTTDDPPTYAALVCPACGAALTGPLRALPDARLFAARPVIRRQGIRATQGFWRRADPGERSQDLPTEAFPMTIHPHDLLVPQVEASNSGCCGVFSADGTANLHCRCGGAVGVLIDECALDIEVRLGAFWQVASGDDGAHVAGGDGISDAIADARVSERLDRWSGVRFAHPAISMDTYWDWSASEVPTHREVERLELALVTGDDGVALQAVVDGRVIALGLAAIDLLRAMALQRLPVGNAGLALRYDQLAAAGDNRVVSFWGLVRRGAVIELVESPASTTYPTGVEMAELGRMPLAEARAIGKIMGRESEPRGWRFTEAELQRAWSAAIAAFEPLVACEPLPLSGAWAPSETGTS